MSCLCAFQIYSMCVARYIHEDFRAEIGELLLCLLHLIDKQSSLKVGRSLPSFARRRTRLPKLAGIHSSKQVLEIAIVRHTCVDVTGALPSQISQRTKISEIEGESIEERERNMMDVKQTNKWM